MFIRLFVVAVFSSLALASSLHAHVKASLVAAETSVQPGKPVHAALRLEHEPHWHTYWINAGTGYPTSLTWELPPGWTAGSIDWPTPILIKDSHGNVTGNGYDGVVYLPVTLTAPGDAKPGDTVTLKAGAEWLMCADVCIPGDAKVELSLPVRAEAPAPSPAAAEIARMSMPHGAADWTLAATRVGKNVTFRVTAPAGAALKAPHFFSEDGLIQYDQPQTVSPGGNFLTLTLPISDSAEPGITKLVGVLAYTDASGAYRGLRVDTPLAGGDAGPTSAPPGATSDSSAAGAPAAPLTGTLVLAFIGGLILNLMPCVFPVLGIKILGFVNQAGAARQKITLHGAAFTLGVLLSFWALAGILGILRAGGNELGWGFQLQSPAFVFVLAAVMLVFGLSMSGVFEFGLQATGVGANLQMKQGYSGSFFTGVLATVVATPCSAPFLAPALGAALALPLGDSFLVFTAIAIGLSTPYIVLSIFPGAVRILPRPGAWMETFKQVMAFPLYATVGYLVWVLAGQVTEGSFLTVLFGLTVIAMGVWFYGRYHAPGGKPARARLGLAGGLVLLALGAWLGWPQAPAPTDLAWEAWSPERVAELRQQGRTIYVDFTARWCATCQANKKVVFGSADVKKVFRDRNIATLKADWTNKDPRITAELAKWNRSAVPFNLVYLPGQPEPRILPELLTPTVVLDAIKGEPPGTPLADARRP
ncbi:MAG TPA: thioredoxin family protein [Opitutaceae bacterium]